MRARGGLRIALLAMAAALLVAALVPAAVAYLHEAAWRVPPEDRRLVDRTLAGGAEAFGTSPVEYRRFTRPRVRRLAGQICVDLRSAHSNGDGSYIACYGRGGRLLSERAVGPSFGPHRISDRLRALIW